jgi:ABC-type multidrug transport system fused ATPase/permease subunit
MVFAIAIEYPFDRYVLKEFNLMALGINTLFPPMLMFLALLGNSAPRDNNTARIIARLKEIIYQENKREHQITIAMNTPSKRPFLNAIFTSMYILTFLLVFGSISYGLRLLHFSIVSIGLFIFFVSVVLFFAYRVRQMGREYILRRRESVLSPVTNFLFLPILNLGKWLSSEIARFNVLIAFFDFVIEAPFKAIFEIFEEWFSFMRKKKDEII